MRAFIWLLGFIAVLWGVVIVNSIASLDLDRFGVIPRNITGLRGIPLHVFIHEGFGHLVSNTIPLITLGGLTSIRGERKLFDATVFIVAFSGVGIWLIGRSAIHIGASGLVFGYFGYLVARGFYERSLGSIIIAVVVGFFYGGILFGILPNLGFVSWEGHLFGLIGGVLYAQTDSRKRREQSA